MKKVMIFLSIIVSGLFVSCEEELEIWDSATYDYAGRWYFKVQGENGQTVKEYGSHLLRTFNSAADVSNEIWIQDPNNVFSPKEDAGGSAVGSIAGIKIKCNINGDYTSFSSVDQTEAGAGENANSFPVPGISPVDENSTNVIPNYFNKGAIIEGKVLEDAGTSKSGSSVDSIYLKMRLFAGQVEYNSVYDDENEEYVWDQGEFSYYAEPDSVVILAGTRYTGFEEDEY